MSELAKKPSVSSQVNYFRNRDWQMILNRIKYHAGVDNVLDEILAKMCVIVQGDEVQSESYNHHQVQAYIDGACETDELLFSYLEFYAGVQRSKTDGSDDYEKFILETDDGETVDFNDDSAVCKFLKTIF